MTGGGKNLKNREKSNSCLCKFLNITTNFIKKIIEELKRKPSGRSSLIPPAGASYRGSILIEFAICMPILIILLFYIHDLVKIKRYYSQTEFVAQQMANILQNIAKTRAITRKDIKYAASLAYLTIYPGTTMFTTKSGSEWHTFNHQPRVYVHYVKGLLDGKASVVWAYWCRSRWFITPDQFWDGTLSSTDQSVIPYVKNVSPSSIYPTLKIEEGKAKIILETQIRWDASGGQRDANGKTAGSAREVFGLRFVNPKYVGNNQSGYFSSVVIFTPNNGFTENAPT